MQDDFLGALVPIDERDPVVMAIRRAVNSFSGSKARWESRLTTGLSERGLTTALAQEFGSQGGFSIDGLSVEYKGGKNPSLSISHPVKIELKGVALLARVREALGVRVTEFGSEGPGCFSEGDGEGELADDFDEGATPIEGEGRD